LIGGIRQTAPAWKELECRPDPELLPERGEIRIPIPRGDFVLTWDVRTINLEIPASTTVRFDCDGNVRKLGAGKFSFARR